MTNELWTDNRDEIKNLDFKVWPMPSTKKLKYRKIAHLLNELPWSTQNVSLEVKTDSESQAQVFKQILKQEHFCAKNFSSEDRIIVVVGDHLNAATFSGNKLASLIVVPMDLNDFAMTGKIINYLDYVTK